MLPQLHVKYPGYSAKSAGDRFHAYTLDGGELFLVGVFLLHSPTAVKTACSRVRVIIIRSALLTRACGRLSEKEERPTTTEGVSRSVFILNVIKPSHINKTQAR